MTSDAHTTSPDDLPDEPDRGVWPTVLGIICMAFGALGVLMSGFSLFGTLVNPGAQTMGMPNDAAKQAATAVFERYMVASATLGAAGVALALLLVVVGVAMLRRHPDLVTITRWWAMGKIVQALGGLAVGVPVMNQITAILRDTAPEIPEVAFRIQSAFVFVAAAWSCALPAFLLLWFARRSVREQVRGWL